MLELIHHAILAVIEKKSTGIFREINYYNQFLKLTYGVSGQTISNK